MKKNNPEWMSIGQKIKQALHESQYSYSQASKLLGYKNKGSVWSLISGKVNPYKRLYDISVITRKDMVWFFGNVYRKT